MVNDIFLINRVVKFVNFLLYMQLVNIFIPSIMNYRND